MANNFNSTPFGEDDLLGNQQTTTPKFNSMKVTGANKLLVVLFLVDCSRSMDGDRIMAVNAALSEVKYTLQTFKNDNGLDLKIAIMSFTSSAKWELQLTDIDEVSLENLKTRPGLTEYGNAFHELNKVLSKEQFMKHIGNVAPPAIIFLTDGGPTDDYVPDLEDLLKNKYFTQASRSVVLLGDAIRDDAAKNAVRSFVEDPNSDIVDAENSTGIIKNIKLATMHTVVGDPMHKGNVGGEIPIPTNKIPSNTIGGSSGTDNPPDRDTFKVDPKSPFGDTPFGESGNDGVNDLYPFGGSVDAGNDGSLGGIENDGVDDLFGGNSNIGNDGLFGEAGNDGVDNSFGGSEGNSPFGGMMKP